MEEALTKIVKEIDNINVLIALFGSFDKNIELLKREFNCNITAHGAELTIIGKNTDAERCSKVLDLMRKFVEKGEVLDTGRVRCCIDLVLDGKTDEITDIMSVVAVTSRGKQIRCKSSGQRAYVASIKKNSVVLAIGPAGTGKTYLAVAQAVMAYKNKEVDKIILTRPAVEAGERLGFLPGDLQTKVDPYLRPLYDALQEMFGMENYIKMTERGVIEVAPLAYMRGRTLSNAFIILDEAQNTTVEQMKMFLTRLGEGSKMVVTGDVTQIDLPKGTRSGLAHASEVLKGIEGIEVIYLSHKDVVRHKLVQDIVRAYENHEKKSCDVKVTDEKGLDGGNGKK